VLEEFRRSQNSHRFTQIAQSDGIALFQSILVLCSSGENDGNTLIGNSRSVVDAIKMDDLKLH
jgi:hypothetical protein